MGQAPTGARPMFAPQEQARPPVPPQAPAGQALTWSPTQRQQQRPAPIIRAQAPDEPAPRPRQIAPRPASLAMPSPEELGLASRQAPEPSRVDWTAVHARLNQLGATCFQLEKRPAGDCRICCLLTSSLSARSRRIEVVAGTEAEAVQAVLDRAESWVGGRATE